jgi:hypothetical protein
VSVDTREFEATLELQPLERYSYLVHRIAGSEEAWALRSEEGWVLINDDRQEGGDAFCLWPHPAFAQACILAGWEECAPEAIPLQELVEEVLPALEEDGIRIAVFPTPEGQVAIVDPSDFRHHLQEELERHRKGES